MNLHVRIGDTDHLLSIDNAAILQKALTAALDGLRADKNPQRDPQDVLDALKQKAADASQSVAGVPSPPDA